MGARRSSRSCADSTRRRSPSIRLRWHTPRSTKSSCNTRGGRCGSRKSSRCRGHSAGGGDSMVTDVGHAQRLIIGTLDEESSGGVLTEVGLVTWRSLVKLTRTPVLLFFSLFMPLIWLVMFSQTFGTVFSSATSGGLPGGPAATPLPYDYVAVLLPGITVMTAIQSASQSGFGMVADLESGFMDKFFVAPIRRSSVLAGKLLADGLRMAAPAGIILGIAAILTLFGWRIPFAPGGLGGRRTMALAAALGGALS